jgi:putative oxidoreductase
MKTLIDWSIGWPERVAQHLGSLAPLFARISAGALGITMIVAIASAKWDQVDSLETLLGFDETEYLALFLWLAVAVAGAGHFSIDRLLNRSLRA